jgi:hypothetical protein
MNAQNCVKNIYRTSKIIDTFVQREIAELEHDNIAKAQKSWNMDYYIKSCNELSITTFFSKE